MISHRRGRRLVVLLLICEPAVASAVRLAPLQSATLLQPPSSGLIFGVPVIDPAPLPDLRDALTLEETPDPLGLRGDVFQHKFEFFGAPESDHYYKGSELLNTLEIDRVRVQDRQGARSETWRVDTHSSNPKVVKVISIETRRDLIAARNEYEAVMSTLNQDTFLPFQDMWKDRVFGFKTWLMIMSEDYEANLEEFLNEHHRQLDVITALNLFCDISRELRTLRYQHIGHDSPIAREVLIIGDARNPKNCRAVLDSSLTNTNVRVRSSAAALRRSITLLDPRESGTELRSKLQIKAADMKSLSKLLTQLLDALTDEEAEKFRKVAGNLAFPKNPSDLIRFVRKLKKRWILRYPGEVFAARNERPASRRRPLASLWKTKAMDNSFEHVMSDITRNVRRGMMGSGELIAFHRSRAEAMGKDDGILN